MTPLKGKEKLHVLEVPEDAENFEVTNFTTIHPVKGILCTLGYRFPNPNHKSECMLYSKNLGNSHFEILGFVTSTEVSFDCEPYVEKVDGLYKNYMVDPCFWFKCFNQSDKSFRSLIEKETGKSFVNTYGEKPKPDDYDYEVYMLENKFDKDLDQWQQAENKLLKKCVILKQM